MTSYKTCAVPMCKSTTVKFPNKLFISIPKHPIQRRKKWLRLARRDPQSLSNKSTKYFCEDHFDLPNDMENYTQYRLMGSVRQIRMKPDCLPLKFQCQPDRIKRTATLQPRLAAKKRQHLFLIEDILSNKNEMLATSGTASNSDFHSTTEKCDLKSEDTIVQDQGTQVFPEIPNVMENYMQYHLLGSVSQIRTKQGCIPTKFECQPNRKSIQQPFYDGKSRKMKVINDCKKQLKKRFIKTKDFKEISARGSEPSGENLEESNENYYPDLHTELIIKEEQDDFNADDINKETHLFPKDEKVPEDFLKTGKFSGKDNSKRILNKPNNQNKDKTPALKKEYKSCAVPKCTNTTLNTPQKIFISVPKIGNIRQKWLQLSQRNPKDILISSTIFFCEDHFDLPNDMVNYMQYHVMGKVTKVHMKPGCIPTKFECQQRNINTSSMIREQTSEECEIKKQNTSNSSAENTAIINIFVDDVPHILSKRTANPRLEMIDKEKLLVAKLRRKQELSSARGRKFRAKQKAESQQMQSKQCGNAKRNRTMDNGRLRMAREKKRLDALKSFHDVVDSHITAPSRPLILRKKTINNSKIAETSTNKSQPLMCIESDNINSKEENVLTVIQVQNEPINDNLVPLEDQNLTDTECQNIQQVTMERHQLAYEIVMNAENDEAKECETEICCVCRTMLSDRHYICLQCNGLVCRECEFKGLHDNHFVIRYGQRASLIKDQIEQCLEPLQYILKVECKSPADSETDDAEESDTDLPTTEAFGENLDIIMDENRRPYHKNCIVPMCKNSINNAPDKIFFHIPRGAKTRKRWCTIMRRDNAISPISSSYCCEDHFNLEEDTENYMEYKIMALQENQKVSLRLKKGVLPHLFQCQKRKPPLENLKTLNRKKQVCESPTESQNVVIEQNVITEPLEDTFIIICESPPETEMDENVLYDVNIQPIDDTLNIERETSPQPDTYNAHSDLLMADIKIEDIEFTYS